ncbi:MAG TPA: cupin domain-containing protein [Burkholderiales bacterium]|nr:cupin domain-containing protein [Burkholderiales bacterium]
MSAVKSAVIAAAVAMTAAVSPSVAGADSPARGSGFVSVKASEIKWSDAPSIGPGAKIAVLEGDPKAAEPFTMRLKLPPNSKIGVHTHPATERVTVLAGTFYFATGDKYDTKKAMTYKRGDAFIVPVGMPMYGYTKKEASVLQIHGTGPWGISYNNPADDPGKKK